MKKHHIRRWLPYTGAAVLLILIVAGLWPQPVPVETVSASVGKLRATINEEGKTRIRQRYVISSPVPGQLQRVAFKAGAAIEKGQTLAVVAPMAPTFLDARSRALAEARRDSAAANLEKAHVAHDFAASELRRFNRLFSDKTVSAQELDAAQMRETSAARDMTAAESQLREADAELADFASNAPSPGSNNVPQEIKSPVSGRVLKVFEENARVVTAGMPLMEVGDPTDLEVVVEVLSRDGATIQCGNSVEFEQWGGNEPLLGRVRLVEPAAFTKVSALGVEEQRVNVVADLLTPPAQRSNVGDAFRVEARIVVWEANDALKIPAGALFRQGDQWAAFVVTEGRAQLRTVETGRSSGLETQILKGLNQGDEVILYPGNRVHNGQRVRRVKI